MDGERAGELKRAATTTRCFSPSKRQQRGIKHAVNADGEGDVDALERLKGSMGGGSRSDGEEELSHSLTTATSISSRKRVRLYGKAVDPAAVPRKLRSAINKRSGEPVSPPLLDAKKDHHVINGIQNMIHDPLTKDEEEVAETLFTLARMVPDSKPAENIKDGRTSTEKSNTKTTISTSLSEEATTKEEITKIPLLSPGMEASNISSHAEVSVEVAVKAETLTQHAVLKQPSTSSRSQEFDLELNTNSQMDLQRNDEHVVDLNCPTELCNSRGISSDVFIANGVLKPAQLKAPPLQKPEIELFPVASASVGNEVQSVKEKTVNNSHLIYREGVLPEATSDALPDLLATTQLHLSWSSSIKAGVWPNSASYHIRHGSTGNDSSTEKVAAGRRHSSKTCATHVYISHLIRNFQKNAGKISRWPFPPSNQSKHEEGSESGVMAARDSVRLKDGLNIPSSGTNGCPIRRNLHDGSAGVQHDIRLQADPLVSTQSEIYSRKNTNCDFLTMSTGCESSNPGKGVESSGHLHVPYLRPLAPHHPFMPFSLTNGHYSSPYPDQLAAAQRLQLQIPHYLSNPFYGLHMGHHPGGSTKQPQQQIWQGNLTHYRPPPGVRQDSRPSDSSSPSLILGGANQLQIFSTPSSSNVKRHQQYINQHHSHHGSYNEGTVFNLEGSSQMQLLYGAQPM